MLQLVEQGLLSSQRWNSILGNISVIVDSLKELLPDIKSNRRVWPPTANKGISASHSPERMFLFYIMTAFSDWRKELAGYSLIKREQEAKGIGEERQGKSIPMNGENTGTEEGERALSALLPMHLETGLRQGW
ncbi:MAG: hypothetical protein QW286_02230 [Candidatus Aenigmatarchaeota archaeon]